MAEIRPLRVFLKALLLFVLFNAAFAFIDPPIGRLSIYNSLVRGRLRVPYEREVEYYNIAHTIPVYDDMDAMFRSHVIARPKPPDEFRVALVGDSSAWAFELRPEETLASQLTALRFTACDGRRITVYNTAFPLPYLAKDVLIMDKVREFDPDMFLWMITLDAFRNRSVFTDFFLEPYAERVSTLVDRYQMHNLDIEKMNPPTFWDKTFIGQRSRLKRVFLLQVHGLAWQATGLDYYYRTWKPLSNDQSDSLLFDVYKPGKLNLDDLLFDVLGAGYGVAGDTPLLVVNEPIFIATGLNSEIRYNEFYPRWAYDYYLDYLSSWMKIHHHDYLDLWDALPASEFMDTPFHRTPEGEKILAAIIGPKLAQMSCGN